MKFEYGRGTDDAVRMDRFSFSNQWLFGLMFVSGAVTLFASMVLSIDAWKIAAEPDIVLGCDLNSVISCVEVAKTWQAQLLGFPNAFLGLIWEGVVCTIGLAGLLGTQFSRSFMLIANLFYTVALFFALWLFSQSFFVIGALCPWCLLVTITTTITFFTITKYNAREDNLHLPRSVQRGVEFFFRVGADIALVVIFVLAIVLMITIKYGPYMF